MSKTSKSPRQVAAAAYRIARGTLPEYNSRYSPRKFTQPQLFVCLVLKIFFKTDYRGIVQILDDCPNLCHTIELDHIPHFTTLQKASKRLLRCPWANKLLAQSVSEGLESTESVDLAAVDSTGLEAGHTSHYYVKRRSRVPAMWQTTTYRRYPKLSVVCDCNTHLILSSVPRRGPCPDVAQLLTTLAPAIQHTRIHRLVADAGYDSEANHRVLREQLGIDSIIPARHGRPTDKLPATKYRRLMKQDFDKVTYGQRWQAETVFSMIKRNFGDVVYARTYWAQCREMMLLVLTHNIAVILCHWIEVFYRAGQVLFMHHALPPRPGHIRRGHAPQLSRKIEETRGCTRNPA
jgi:hypothetical protein